MTQEEPAIVSYGRQYISEYGVDEYEEAIRRAFKDKLAFIDSHYIVLDSNSRGQKFLSACVAWALGSGLLRHDTSVDDGQSIISTFRLTPFGKVHLFG